MNYLSEWRLLRSTGVSIMPFDDRDVSNRSSDLRSPLSLVSFWVTDVNRAHQSKKSVSVSGLLQIGITLDGLFSSKPYERSPHFDIWPGHSAICVFLKEYTLNRRRKSRERVMCLLGTTMLPSRQQESTDPWGFTHQESLTVVPNWKCNGTDDFCSQLGPFRSDKEIKATDGGFKDVKLVLQDIRCDEISVKDNVTSARVSSVFRVVSPLENQFTAAQRTGLNNMTLSAEVKSSSGQLCMVGCRSIIIGHFLADGLSRRYFPLSFEKLIRPVELWDQYTASHPYYKYSKINAAATVLRENEPFSFGSMFKKSLLTFPKLEDKILFPSAFRFFLKISLFTHQQLQIKSLVQLTKELRLKWRFFLLVQCLDLWQMVPASPEGLYDPHVGKMYLIGCRDVRASWKILSESMDLEAGLDCLIEVIIAYPPTTARWLVNPTAKISVSSQRNEDDPLYFNSVNLQTFPIIQLFYIRDNAESVPYVSLAMLVSSSWLQPAFDHRCRGFVQNDGQQRGSAKGVEIRIRLRQGPLEPHCVPSDKWVLLSTLFGDIAIPVAAVLLAVVVYIQQRWNYEKQREALKFGKIKLLPAESQFTKRLPSEAELTSVQQS
ncbi:hypothetical protein HAX54_008548 [Datura stramonium]|uniref:DUF2921 domain-containing protein n=1 Tax=Datura stramonium TaxID=4076 RepID=A0ABS8RVF9_DATST|nr:hypothetical protein [Datura stramonium]